MGDNLSVLGRSLALRIVNWTCNSREEEEREDEEWAMWSELEHQDIVCCIIIFVKIKKNIIFVATAKNDKRLPKINLKIYRFQVLYYLLY